MFAQNGSSSQHNFAAIPKVVEPRTKYRQVIQEEPEPVQRPQNIMWDTRVIKGNTYAAVVTTSRENAVKMRTIQPRPKKTIQTQLGTGEFEAVHADVSTPRPVDGRKHVEVQTDDYVELLTDKPPEYEHDTQTDFYIDRPVNRLFVPKKIGEDRETQIWEGELFDFDSEVEPILQVLIGKTLEQGRMEVLEEEELKIMKEEQKRYDELRYAELAEAQKMEAEETRKLEESERRKKQHRLQKQQSVTSHKKLISRVLAKEYLKNVRNNSLQILQEQGTFRNAFSFEVNHTILPWLYEDILGLQEGRQEAIETIASLTRLATQNLEDLHKKAIQAEKDRKRRVQEEKERVEAEKIERRSKRAEARKKREEDERRKQLQEKIAALLVAKGEKRPNMFSQVISDMDALGREGMNVGLLGGIVGEVLLVLSTLDDFKKAEPEDPLAVLKSIDLSKEAVQKVIDFIVGELIKEGKIEIGVSEDIDAQLEAIEPDLNLENLHTKPNRANEIRELLLSSINSFVLNVMREHADELSLKLDHVELIANALINFILASDEKGRKIKLVKAPLDYTQDARFEAVTVFMPNTEEANLFNLAEVKGKQNKKGRKASKKESMTALDDLGKSEEGDSKPVNPAEIDFDDAVTVFPLYNQDLRVLVHQRPVSIVLRREILLFLSTLFKELDMREIEVLKRVINKSKGIEELVANKFAKVLPVLTFDKN